MIREKSFRLGNFPVQFWYSGGITPDDDSFFFNALRLYGKIKWLVGLLLWSGCHQDLFRLSHTSESRFISSLAERLRNSSIGNLLSALCQSSLSKMEVQSIAFMTHFDKHELSNSHAGL